MVHSCSFGKTITPAGLTELFLLWEAIILDKLVLNVISREQGSNKELVCKLEREDCVPGCLDLFSNSWSFK